VPDNNEMSQEELDALAAWETSAAEPPKEVKELDQNEIDSLLGFGVSQGQKNTRGIKAMIDRALESYERLPMLEIVFERFIRVLSTNLRNLTEDNVDLTIKSIQSLRYGNFIKSIPMPALVNVFRAKEWDHYGLFIADNSLIFSLIDILFGGKKSNRPVKIEGRPFTLIEQGLVKQLADIVLSDLSDSFSTLGNDVTFKFENTESDPRFASIARTNDSCVLTKISVEIQNRKGTIEILFPYEAIEPIKALLTQVFIGEQFGTDVEWQSSVIEKVYQTELKLQAVLDSKDRSILDISNLKVGSTIIMENAPDADIDILCNGVKITSGKLGRMGKKLAIALSAPIENHNIHE